jgi:exodeoxyribonuclease-1
MSNLNKLVHDNAHDALSDVNAAISLARLIKEKQPKLYKYLLDLRTKGRVSALVEKGDPVVYTSGRYPGEFEKTTVAVMAAPSADGRGALMYDMRVDPQELIKLTPAELAAKWSNREKDAPYFPVKQLTYNRCPAVAPLLVLDNTSAKRLQLDKKTITQNLNRLREAKEFGKNLQAAQEILQSARQTEIIPDEQKVDSLLYEGFVNGPDKTKTRVVRSSSAEELEKLDIKFDDQRLNLLLPLYKARNYLKILNEQEQTSWEKFRNERLVDGGDLSRAVLYFKRIGELSSQPKLSENDRYLLEELNLYGQSILPGA